MLNVGCATRTAEPSWAAWAARQGGIVATADAGHLRAVAALERFRQFGSGSGRSLSVQVLASERACAYAWPDGTVFVARGLLRLLNDDELAAAVAHELAHLSAGPAPVEIGNMPAALRGTSALPADHESRADAIACDLLDGIGLSPAPLARALAKVRDDPLTPRACGEPLDRRVRLLERRAMAVHPENPCTSYPSPVT